MYNNILMPKFIIVEYFLSDYIDTDTDESSVEEEDIDIDNIKISIDTQEDMSANEEEEEEGENNIEVEEVEDTEEEGNEEDEEEDDDDDDDEEVEDDDDDEEVEDDEPVILTKPLLKKLKKFINKTDIKFWSEFTLEDEPRRNKICNSLKNLKSTLVGDYYYILIGVIDDDITNDDINNELEGIFAGWYDSDPMIISDDGEDFAINASVSISN